MSHIHFAMQPQGFLLLGQSESTNTMQAYFRQVERNSKLFQKMPGKMLPVEKMSFNQRSLPARSKALSKPLNQAPTGNPIVRTRNVSKDAHDRLFNQYVPPSMVLNASHEIIHSFGNLDRYTKKLTPGSFSSHFSTIVSPKLTSILEAALNKLRDSNKPIVMPNISTEDDELRVGLEVSKMSNNKENDEEPFYLVSFLTPLPEWHSKKGEEDLTPNEQALVTRLEQADADLISAHLVINERESDISNLNEELQASNEELKASNEELQSTNEELHSVNEELYTVNAELQEKIQQLEDANNDLDNILALSNVGVVYLDNHLRIRRFTSKMREFIKLLPVDMHRPITDIASEIDEQNLGKLLDEVLRNQQPIERMTSLKKDPDRRVRIVISPSRDRRDQVEGLILMMEEIPEDTTDSGEEAE